MWLGVCGCASRLLLAITSPVNLFPTSFSSHFFFFFLTNFFFFLLQKNKEMVLNLLNTAELKVPEEVKISVKARQVST